MSAPFVEIERYYSTTSQIHVGRVSREERGKESDFHPPFVVSPSRRETIPMKRKRRSARPRIVLHLSLQGSIINGRDLPLHGSSGERNPRRTSLLAKRSKPVKISRLTRAQVGRKKKIESIDPNTPLLPRPPSRFIPLRLTFVWHFAGDGSIVDPSTCVALAPRWILTRRHLRRI